MAFPVMSPRLPLADGKVFDPPVNQRPFRDDSDIYVEWDPLVTGRTGRVTSSQFRSHTSTPTPLLASDVARKRKPLLHAAAASTKQRPQLSTPSKNASAIENATSTAPRSDPPAMSIHQAAKAKSDSQPTATLPLPEVPNITELVSGVHDNGTTVFSDFRRRNASRFAPASQASDNPKSSSALAAEEVKPKYDEKKLLASIQHLEQTVAELKHRQAESDHTIRFLRQKAFESESKGRNRSQRSDSALGSVTGSSDGEDKTDGAYRKLLIEKNRIESAFRQVESRVEALNEIAVTYQENLQMITQERDNAISELELRFKTLNEIAATYKENLQIITQERDDAISELGSAHISNKQLRLQNEALQAENAHLNHHVDDLIAHQEESNSSIGGFEVDPDMDAKDAECDRIMLAREQAMDTRQRIKKDLRARRGEVVEAVPELLPGEFRVPDDSHPNKPASSHEDSKVTIDDVSLPLSLAPTASAGVRQELEVNQSDDNVAPTPMRGQESVLPQSVAVSSNWEDHSSFGGGNGFSGLIDSTGLHNERCGWSPEPVLTTRQKIQSRKVTPFAPRTAEVQPPKPEASIISARSRSADRSNMTSPWNVPDISIGMSASEKEDGPPIAPPPAEASDRPRSDNSQQSTVGRALCQAGAIASSLPGDHGKSPVERPVGESQDAWTFLPIVGGGAGHTEVAVPSSLGDDFKASFERDLSQNQAFQRSLRADGAKYAVVHGPTTSQADKSNPAATGNISQNRVSPRSLLDDDPNPISAHSTISRPVGMSPPAAEGGLNPNRAAPRSLLDDHSKSLAIPSYTHPKVKRTKVVRKPIPVSDRMPAPGTSEEEPTLRPSQHPGIALATVLKDLEDERSELKLKAQKYQMLYDSHDSALSKRSRKSVMDKIQALYKTMDAKADQIYSLYDVLEGQKQSGQEMTQAEVEVTLQSIGIDAGELSYASGFKDENKSINVAKVASRPGQARSQSSISGDDLPWNGEITGTHSTSSSRRSHGSARRV